MPRMNKVSSRPNARWSGASGWWRVVFPAWMLALLLAWPSGLFAQDAPAVGEEASPVAETAEAAETAAAAPVESTSIEHAFTFGSYGRIQAAGDLKGHPAQDINVAGHGPRILEGPYAELDFGYRMEHPKDDFAVRMQITLALFEDFFHFTGDVDQRMGLRNLYAEAEGFLPYVKLWLGSRMYRGDDIYLFDYWPLDNLNTVGGGVGVFYKALEIKWQAGVNRLTDDFQFQELEVPGRGVGAESVVGLDRQRFITSLKGTYHLFDVTDHLSMKVSLYGEFHHLPSGGFTNSETQTKEDLPSDLGWVVGAQLGLWDFAPHGHFNLFLRYAERLAAYGEWGVPWGLNNNDTTDGAQELVAGFSLNWESRWVGVMGAGYVRKFKDADPNEVDLDDFWEGALAARPHIFITDHFHQGFEFSYQWRRPEGLSVIEETRLVPQVWQLSVMEVLSWDRGTYERPQFRLVYTLSHLNKGARDVFPLEDRRRDSAWQHYFGAQVEWWFNSSYR